MSRGSVIIHTPDEIRRIRKAAQLSALAREQIAREARPGMSTKELDDIAGAIIHSLGGRPAFLGYCGYPANICISVNDEVVHGIASPDRYLLKGDVVSLDVGVAFDGAMGDTAMTVYLGDESEMPEPEARLLKGTSEALEDGIRAAVCGVHIRDVARAVEKVAKEYKLGVVREYVGHGCGIKLHEPPEVPNFVTPERGPKLQSGMVICIEPMLNLGTRKIFVERDRWTVRTADGARSAHFEHMVLITDGQPEVLTRV